MIDIVPLGDRAYLARFVDELSARDWARGVEFAQLRGVEEVVLAYRSVAVYLDPEEIEGAERRLLEIVPWKAVMVTESPVLRLPVVYDGEDLHEVGQRLGLTPGEVVEAHAGRYYAVFALGFLPGFPYCGYLPNTLSGLPRRPVPRTRLPAGSVAIAGRQTGIYPRDSPGGWHWIGRTLAPIADAERDEFPILAGQKLAFEPVSAAELADRQGRFLERRQRGEALSCLIRDQST